jgi:hypothetical protein
MFNVTQEELMEILNEMLDVPAQVGLPNNVHFIVLGFVVGDKEAGDDGMVAKTGETSQIRSGYLTSISDSEVVEKFLGAVLEAVKRKNRSVQN